jgi:hypothetical protein
MENLNFEQGQTVTFKNKKKEILVGTFVKEYLYKKTNQVFYILNVSGKKRLVTKNQICNETI